MYYFLLNVPWNLQYITSHMSNELAIYNFTYEVERNDKKAVVLQHDLPWHGVLHVVKKDGKKFILEKDKSCIEDII